MHRTYDTLNFLLWADAIKKLRLVPIDLCNKDYIVPGNPRVAGLVFTETKYTHIQ